MVKVLIAGTFDNFHVGHQWLIWSAVQQGNAVTIIVARDATVEKLKQQAPRNQESERLQRVQNEVAHLKHVMPRLGRADADFWQTIEESNPEKILLGYDQHLDETQLSKRFPQIKVQRCDAYQPKWFKSSKFN